MITTNTRRASILVATALTAVVALAGATQASSFAPTPYPKAGQCKTTAEAGIGLSPTHAQQAWSAKVASKYTGNWSIWHVAANQVVVPIKNGPQTLYQAVARPCFVPPVP